MTSKSVPLGWRARHEVFDRRRATERKLAGVNTTTIRAGQDLSDRNAVIAERFSDELGLLNAAGGKVYFLGAVTGRELPDSFSHVDVSVAQLVGVDYERELTREP